MTFHLGRYETLVTFGALVLYFVMSMVLYMVVAPQPDAWTALGSIYFSVVVISTVGYGDYVPKTSESKLVTVLFVHFALIVGSFIISNVVHSFREAYLYKTHQQDFRLGVFNRQEERRHQKRRFWLLLASYALTLSMGTLYFSYRMPWASEDGNRFVNGLYLTVITVTSIGFGDYSPKNTWDLQLVGILLMLVGIPICISTFSCLTTVVFGEAHEKRRLRILQGQFTEDKFNELVAFVHEMRQAGVGNYRSQGYGKVSHFEYLVFMLTKNGLCDLDHVKAAMANFEAACVSGRDFITIDDVREYEQRNLYVAFQENGDCALMRESSRGERRVLGRGSLLMKERGLQRSASQFEAMESDALHEKVESLSSELEEAQQLIARLQGKAQAHDDQ